MELNNGRTGRVARWEARQQAKFDRQQAEQPAKDAAYAARNVYGVVSPRGRTYAVRAVKRGDWLVENVFNDSANNALELPVALVRFLLWVPTAIWRRVRTSEPRWTVGVIFYGGSLWRIGGEVVVHREHLAVGVDEAQRVQELVQQVRDGSLDIRSRLAPWRKI